MMSVVAQLTLPELESHDDDNDDNENHIICMCRPTVTFCGRLDESPLRGYIDDADDVCPGCDEVAFGAGCAICGCKSYQLCDACLNDPL